MNTKIHKKLNELSINLMKAADQQDEKTFYCLYDELKALCFDNESDSLKNHPEQWETLADFTDELTKAIEYYQVASKYAKALKLPEFMASIHYSMAVLYKDHKQVKQALECANTANANMKRVRDHVMQDEIDQLITALSKAEV
jgi:tetratricopeptide (TPR) repeat protein